MQKKMIGGSMLVSCLGLQDTGFGLSESCVVVVLQQGRDNDSQQDEEYDC
jgi:hypothetical protein